MATLKCFSKQTFTNELDIKEYNVKCCGAMWALNVVKQRIDCHIHEGPSKFNFREIKVSDEGFRNYLPEINNDNIKIIQQTDML